MSHIIITNVGDPNEPKQKPNGSFDAGTVRSSEGETHHWFQVEVEARRGLRKMTATRNFWIESRNSLDREAAVQAMRDGANVGAGRDGIQVTTVDIEPRPVVVAGEQRLDANGEPIFQTSATIVVLPGETVRSALSSTFSGAKLLADHPEEEKSDARLDEQSRKADVLRNLSALQGNGVV